MKKILAIVLVVAVVAALVAVFIGCEKKNEETVVSFQPVAKDQIKLGLITLHDSNSTYDKNFIDAANEAATAMGINIVISSGIDENEDCYNEAVKLIEQGCNIIFADSFGHEPYIAKAAAEYPNVRFAHATGTSAHTKLLGNFYNAFASIYEGRYLAGVAAGLKLVYMNANSQLQAKNWQDGKILIGYIGAYPYAEVISGYTSYYLGVCSVLKEYGLDAKMQVTFTNSWYDPVAEKNAAEKLIGNGCALISQHADSMGAPNACKEAGVPNVTYNISTVAECGNSYLVGSKINWVPYFKYLIECTMDGVTAVGFDYVGTLANGGVQLTGVNEAVAAPGTQAYLDTVAAQLIAGTRQVYDISTFTVDGKPQNSYLADVDDLGDFAPDTQVIKNGVFMESYYRSAPYFDMTVDGIVKIDEQK